MGILHYIMFLGQDKFKIYLYGQHHDIYGK